MPVVQSWKDITIGDLFMAYRKAKVDAFYEYSIPTARAFALFERDLPQRLSLLLAALKKGKVDLLLRERLGQAVILPKKLTLQPLQESAEREHRYFSDPGLAFGQLITADELIPEFRTGINATIDGYIVTALWMNLVGHKFEARLTSSVYASRLKRKSPTPGGDRPYNLEAIGTYEAYADPYKRWRNDGFRTLRRELQAGTSVIALSLDIESYYHNVDPSFLNHPDFLDRIGLSLNDFDLQFTTYLVSALKSWSRSAADLQLSYAVSNEDNSARPIGGIPIGLPIARLLANMLLYDLDVDIQRHLTPLYYGRYVDDMFLILKNPGTLDDAKAVLEYLEARVPSIVVERTSGGSGRGKGKRTTRTYRLDLGKYQGASRLRLQPKKQKAFFLKGEAGLDLIETIESQVREVSSERRLMPNTARLEKTASARVLAASNNSWDQADTIAKADGLAIRRLSWSVQLRSVETLERDLPALEWRGFRARFYRFAKDHVLRPERILDHLDYLPRLLGVASAAGDWDDVDDLLTVTLSAIRRIADAHRTSAVICGRRLVVNEVQRDRLWTSVLAYVCTMSLEAILRALYCHNETIPAELPEQLSRVLATLANTTGTGLDMSVGELVADLQRADMSRVPYKELVQRSTFSKRVRADGEEELYCFYKYLHDLEDFLGQPSPRFVGPADSLLPFICSTRPFSPQEIANLVPGCVLLPPPQAAYTWKRFVRACRGVPSHEFGVMPAVGEDPPSGDKPPTAAVPPRVDRVVIGRESRPHVKIGISSFYTSDHTWRQSGSGHPDVSLDRYQRMGRLVDEAIRAHPRPDYLLLPELGLPRRWVRTVSERLQEAGIDLVAGLEYVGDDRVHSSALLVLADGRLGYPSSVQVVQDKSRPAPGEEEELLRLFGKSWTDFPDPDVLPRVVYDHNGFCFGVLICSELQNISHRQWFQGRVDALIVLSWNRDLETFSALVEAASLDVHSYVALTNNRKYGDSRIRAPGKEAHQRDICRLRGGENDHVVVSKIDIISLREFQSRSRPWARDGDLFKPVPDGFQMSSYRRTLPK